MFVDKHNLDYSLYLVTDRMILNGRDFLICLEESLASGVTLVQFREKDLESSDFYTAAMSAVSLCHRYRVPCIINDRIDIMLAVNADGIHIGQQDLPVDVARQLVGPERILGYSVSNVQEARCGARFADYLGAGPVFPTGSKADAVAPIGVDVLQTIKSAVNMPVVAIGGIAAHNVPVIKSTGADGVAVISALWGKADIGGACRELRARWEACE